MTRHLALLMTLVSSRHTPIGALLNTVARHRVAAAAALLVASAALWLLMSLRSGHSESLRRSDLPEYAAYTHKITSWS